jgi:hypothetical protein
VAPDREQLLAEIHHIIANATDRLASIQALADLLRNHGKYRWVGLYEVDHVEGTVTNVAWSGPGAPEFSSREDLSGALERTGFTAIDIFASSSGDAFEPATSGAMWAFGKRVAN